MSHGAGFVKMGNVDRFSIDKLTPSMSTLTIFNVMANGHGGSGDEREDSRLHASLYYRTSRGGVFPGSAAEQNHRVLDMVKGGKVDNVVILKLDRLARNVKEAVEVADLLQKKGVALHSISEKLDTGSASGRLFYNILSAMGQWEREVIAERTRDRKSVV